MVSLPLNNFYQMPNTATYNTFFDCVKESITNGTFAKLTLAKTIGNTDLMNIYLRATLLDEVIGFEITFKFQQEEKVEITSIEEGLQLVLPYMGNPFLSLLLFTTDADITVKLNKKRVATITQQSPTFKNASTVISEFYADN